MPSLQHMAALGGNNDTGWEGRWCEPDEALGLKRQRGRNESRTGQTVKWQHGTRTGAGRSDFSIHIKSSVYTYTHTHTTGSSKQRQHCGPHVWKYFPRSGKFSFASPLIYCTGAFYVCGGQSTERSYAQYLGLSLHVGWCYWKLSGSFLCEHCCSGLGPGPARGLVQHRSALAWPQSAFLSHAAPDLLTHFLTQEIELTPQPGPWGPTAAYTAVH